MPISHSVRQKDRKESDASLLIGSPNLPYLSFFPNGGFGGSSKGKFSISNENNGRRNKEFRLTMKGRIGTPMQVLRTPNFNYEGRGCPACKKGLLKKRRGKFGLFLGCNRFPDCKMTAQFKLHKP